MSTTSTTDAAPPRPAFGFLRTPAAKAAMLLALLLLMQVPLLMVSSLIEERQGRQAEVLHGFERGWGPAQAVIGPLLAVPYTWTEPAARVGDAPIRRRAWLRAAPSRLDVEARLRPETRRRGMFEAIVYTAEVELSGTLPATLAPPRDLPGAEVLWQEAVVVVAASDLRGLQPDTRIEWNGASLPLDPVEVEGGCGAAAVAAPARLAGPAAAAIPFRTSLTLRGTGAFRVAPTARQLGMRVASPWPTPGFVGAALPLNHAITPDGFTAAWQVSGAALAPQSPFGPAPDCRNPHDGDLFGAAYQTGVELREAVPTYVMVDRASKYGTLFLALSFLTYFLFEQLARVRIHVAQYALLGLSVSLFALLLVAVAEPAGFLAGYLAATALVLGQATTFTLSVTGRPRLAAAFGAVLAGLFGFLYVVLSLDAYALLAGTAALFAALSVVMAVTRRVDWGAAGG